MGNENNEFMIIEEKCKDKSAYFVLKGCINAFNACTIQQYLERSLRNGRIHIIINMCRVEHLSSDGIRVLLGMYEKTKARSGNLRVENPSKNVMNALAMAAPDEMLLK